MKLPSHPSIWRGPALTAATVAVLFGAASAVAQTSGASGGAGATSAGSSQKNPSGTSSSISDTDSRSSSSSADISRSTAPSNSSSAAAGNTLHTGAAADVDSTKEINAQTDTNTSIGAGAMTGRETSSGNKLGWMERRWVTKVADDGQAEVALAQLATEKASSAEVKAFAQKLVDDHTKVNEELKSLASQKNVKLDTDDDHDRAYKRMAKKSGGEFDQEFVEHMIDEHEKDIKMFEKAAKDAKDSDLRAFAAKHVDHLREHLASVQSLKQSLMPTGRTDDQASRSSSDYGTDNKSRHEETTSHGSTSPSSTYTPDTSSTTSPANDDTSRSGTTKRDGSP